MIVVIKNFSLAFPFLGALSYVFFLVFSCGFWSICLKDALKVSTYESVKKEEVAKDDQLSLDVKNLNLNDEVSKDGKATKLAQSFTFDELADATGNFRLDCFLGEGGFGKVYKGFLERTNQVS